MNKQELEKNLLIFTLLATQSELYGYAIKGNVKHEFNYKLNEYLRTTKQLLSYINEFIDAETLENNSEEISLFIETLTNNN